MSTTSKELLRVTDSESFRKLITMFPGLTFEEEVATTPELSEHLRAACSSNANQVDAPRTRPDAPKLDEDFSKYFVINNLPKCDEAKAKKLTALLIKLFQKKNLNIDESSVTMPMGSDGQSEGVAFILAGNEEQAKFAAALMNGY